MNTTNTSNNNEAGKAGKAGVWQGNGFKVAKTDTKANTVSSYCFKCGKAKSAHSLFGGCPK